MVKMIAASVAENDINTKIMKSLLTLMSLGLGEIVGSLSIGPIIDKYPSSITTYITLSLILIQIILALLFVSNPVYGFLCFALTFFWGLQDSCVNTHLSQLLGFQFDDNVRPFSAFNVIQSCALFIYLTAEGFVRTKGDQIAFYIISGVLGLVACTIALRFPQTKKAEASSLPNSGEKTHQ